MTQVLHIPVKVKNAGIKDLMSKVKIEGTFGIVTTIQFLDEVNNLKGYNVLGQILGCNIRNALKEDVDAYLYIGSGKFHPLNLAFQQEKPIYTLNPISQEFSRISEEEIKKYKMKRKGALLKYLTAKKIGIIVSTKSGQNQIKRALRFKETCNKESYIFLCDNVKNMEDFNDIECWVNTACTRIVEDDLPVPIVNIREVETL